MYVALPGGPQSSLPLALLTGLGLVVTGLVAARSGPVCWGVGVLGASYVLAAAIRGSSVDLLAPVVACALFATAELAHWSIDSRLPAREDRRAHLQRARAVGLAGLAGLALAVIATASALA